MKIFAAGVSTETNTFAALPTGLDDFNVLRGKDVAAGRVDHPSLDLSATWGRLAETRGCDFVFAINAWAPPSGITLKSAYEQLRDELLAQLHAEMPVDVVLLSLHGAMVAQGYDDCEQDILSRVRSVVGPEPVIAVELDLHCHLTTAKLHSADIVITFKEYPHTDVNERAREVFDLALATKLGEVRPKMALFDCRMVGLYPTTCQPLRSLVDAMMNAEGMESVLSISFAHGFPYADLPHVGAKVLVITDDDDELAQRLARQFGLRLYEHRREIGFDSRSLGMEEALAQALASPRAPVVVADQSDNTGGGAPGDATFALRWLLDHGAEKVAIAIFYDPEVVRIARKVGVGAALSIRLGGKLGPSSGNPVDMDVTVTAVRENYMHEFPQQSGPPVLSPAGDVVALRCGSVHVVVSSIRCQCFGPAIFSDLGIDPSDKQVLIPKSIQHFYAAFAPIAAEVIYMAAPGAVAPDPRCLTYQRLDTTRLYPWIEDPLA
jgi:microcystin degradation protein MlrC